MTFTYQVFNNEKYGGEAKNITKQFGSFIEASDFSAYLKSLGWTSVCWYQGE